MSAAPEQKVWRGKHGNSGPRPAIPQIKSTATTPATSGTSSPNAAHPSKIDNSKPIATTTPIESLAGQSKQAPAPTGNIWEQRKAATHGQNVKTPASAAGKAAASKPTSDMKAAPTAAATSNTTNGFDATEVQRFLSRDASSFKTYRVADSNPKPVSAASKGNTASGQNFFAQLSKQVAQLQNSK